MTLREFLDAAYAVLVDEYRRHGQNLFQALEEMSEWAQGGKQDESEAAVIAQNTRALADMDAIMAGIG